VFSNLNVWEVGGLLLLALFIFGPERLPKVISDGVRFLRSMRTMARNATNDLSRELGTEVKLEDLHPRTFIRTPPVRGGGGRPAPPLRRGVPRHTAGLQRGDRLHPLGRARPVRAATEQRYDQVSPYDSDYRPDATPGAGGSHRRYDDDAT